MSDTPSEAIVAAAQQITEISDAAGRKLTLRTLNVVDQARLLRAIGPQQSSNEPYVNLVQAAASVSAIDGVPQPMPMNEKQIDAALGRIGDAGFAAIMAHMKRQMDDLNAAAEAAVSNAEASVTSPLPQSAP